MSTERLGTNARRALEKRKATRNERMVVASRAVSRIRWQWLAFPLLALVVGWGAWLGFQKLELRKSVVLKHVELSGNRMLSWEEVLGATGVELGTPMLDLQMDSIQAKLQRLDLVKTVEVKRAFPSTLKIKLTEAEPLFLVSDAKGWKVFSDKGTRLPFRQDLGLQLPVVSHVEKQGLAQAVQLLAKMRELDPVLFANASQVVTMPGRQWAEVYFRNVPHKVLFNVAADDDLVFHRYRLLVSSLSKEIQGATTIDMRFPGFAVARAGDRENQDG